MDYTPWIFVVLAAIAVGIVGWMALRAVPASETRRQEALARYQRLIDVSETTHKLQLEAIELTKAGQHLAAESNSIMRELVSELRAARQAPGAPPDSDKLSN